MNEEPKVDRAQTITITEIPDYNKTLKSREIQLNSIIAFIRNQMKGYMTFPKFRYQ